MTARAEYTDDEWELLYLSPWVVGAAVAFAEKGGTLRELMTVATLAATVRERYPANELMRSLWPTRQGTARTLEPTAGVEPTRFKAAPLERAVDACRRVVALLGERSNPTEAEGFRRFLGEVAVGVAQAARSGGILGFGGVPVTPAEHAAADAIRASLDLEPMTDAEGMTSEGGTGAPPPPDTVRGGGPDIPSGPIGPS